MDIKLTKGSASLDTVTAISSKSYVHRLMIAASLYSENISIITNIISKDMQATAGALNALGGCVTVTPLPDGKYMICTGKRLGDERISSCLIDCGESGSTARFMLPVAAVLADKARLTGSGRLPQRPMGPLCDVLRTSGLDVSADTLPIDISGRFVPGPRSIPGNVSSQFISGLLFAMPLLEGASTLKVTGGLESAAYVDMTMDVLAAFGIGIGCKEGVYDIKGKESKVHPAFMPHDEIYAEGDWSNGAYIMTMAALGCGGAFDRFYVGGLSQHSLQPDRAAAALFGDFGIDVAYDAYRGSYEIKGRPADPVDTDCSQIPDLVPALAALAAYADGDSVFRNVGRLRMKESDRVEAVKEMLGAVSVTVDIISDKGREDMIVHGKGQSGSGSCDIVIDSFNDHRIAMAACALAFAEDGPVTVRGAEAVDKSYPGFFDVAEKMGLATEVI